MLPEGGGGEAGLWVLLCVLRWLWLLPVSDLEALAEGGGWGQRPSFRAQGSLERPFHLGPAEANMQPPPPPLYRHGQGGPGSRVWLQLHSVQKKQPCPELSASPFSLYCAEQNFPIPAV